MAVEVFEGNTADPGTLGGQVKKLCERFGLSKVVVVGDRRLLTSARIREEVEPTGLDWITALRAPEVKKLADDGCLQMSLFDEQDLAEIEASALYPGERLVVCRNPLLAARDAVRAYKALVRIERAFRSLKTVDLKVRPVHHRLAGRVRAHVFLCMLAY